MLAESVNFIELINEEFKIKEPVLDIGSKIRRKDYVRTSVKKILPGKDCIGLDIEPGWGVDRVADAHELPFEDKSIGTIFMIETIEHLWEPTRAMREISRVIVPGGILAFTAVWVFNKPIVVETERRYLGICYPIHHKNDWWRFSDWSIGRLLRENDFKLISLTKTMVRAFVIAQKRKTPYKRKCVGGGLVN